MSSIFFLFPKLFQGLDQKVFLAIIFLVSYHYNNVEILLYEKTYILIHENDQIQFLNLIVKLSFFMYFYLFAYLAMPLHALKFMSSW